MVLPLRNWKQTKKELSGIKSIVKDSYDEFGLAKRKAKRVFETSKRGYGELQTTTRNIQSNVERVGVPRTIIGRTSIYDEKPKKISELKRKFFGGSIYDE